MSRSPNFRQNEAGTVAVIFAIAFSAILLTVAITIDFALGTAEQTREQQALDAAALAASDFLGLPDQDAKGASAAQAYFQENIGPKSNATLESVKIDATDATVTASASGSITSSFLKLFGVDSLKVGSSTLVMKGDGAYEIALVLDNSGSMAGTYITDLKTAAKHLASIMFSGANGSDKVRIGVIPFAGSVNVGSQHRTSPWIDTDGESSIHYENLATHRTRFQLFDDMGVGWGGCVEVRPGDLGTNDAPPVPGAGDTHFVPMMAVDEPDASNDGGATYTNSYLVDDAGACTPQPTTCTKVGRNGKCTQTSKTPLAPEVAQARVCKYAGQSPSGGSGPNAGCSTKSLLPLTSDRLAVESKIDSLTAGGNTNIGEGLMWGWRVLSPGEPFTEGKDYSAPNNKKVIILMTDGENTYSATSNHNSSTYGAFGYAAKGRLGNVFTNTAFNSFMNSKLISACTNAKAAGVLVYTVAFRLESDPATLQLLKDCASAADKAFTASNGTNLIATFQNIAKQLTQLRVAG